MKKKEINTESNNTIDLKIEKETTKGKYLKGFRSIGITGLSHNLEDYYHTRRDTCDHLDEAGLENCYLATIRFIEKLEEQLQDCLETV